MAPQTQSNSISVDVTGLRQLSRDINSSGNRYLKLRLQQGLREGAEVVAVAARSKAAFSTRIPDSIRVAVTARGAYVRAGSARAPHAVTFEGTASGGPRRHPVFARGGRATWTWVPQSPRPFLLPALIQTTDQVVEKVADAMERAFLDMGWRQ